MVSLQQRGKTGVFIGQYLHGASVVRLDYKITAVAFVPREMFSLGCKWRWVGAAERA